MVQARPHRVLCLLVGLWLVNVFDLLLTVSAHRAGLLHETNPIAAFVLDCGPVAICAFKVGLVVLGSIPLIRCRREALTELAAAGLLLVYVVVAVRWKLCYEIYDFTHSGSMSNIEALKEGGDWSAFL